MPPTCWSNPPDSGIRDVLLKQKEEAKLVNEEEISSVNLRNTINELRKLNQEIATIKKNRVFDDEITPEEMEIIDKRVELQQRQFHEYQVAEQERKVARIASMWDFLSREEISLALEENSKDEDQSVEALTDPLYIHSLRKKIAKRAVKRCLSSQRDEYDKLVEKRSRNIKKTTDQATKTKCRMLGRLRLDDAISQLSSQDPSVMFEGWSEARIKAYKQINTNPNSYYYRFNAPGELQRNGPWTEAEKTLFKKRMNEMGVDGQWGIFSQAIPGRVGYQCSNYYRGMIKSGRMIDPNYFVDDKGTLHYLFGKGKEGSAGVVRKHSKSHARSERSTAPRRKRKTDFESDDGDHMETSSRKARKPANMTESDSEPEFTNARHTRAHGVPVSEAMIASNPLPGFIDPITLEPVIKPAISPYGHVMGYDNWLKCLSKAGSVCPLTKKPLQRRELILLNFDNIDEYRDRIVN